MQPIAHVRTCYGEKFGTPRQPGLVAEAWGEIIFEPEYRNPDTVRELEGFSHLWLIFLFHQISTSGWKPTVRPPRLGGNERIGVFASRSPFRPNPIGLSCVEITSIDLETRGAPIIHLRGVDLVDGTPLLDIKPYIPYADAPEQVTGGFASDTPPFLQVEWNKELRESIDPTLVNLIESTLACDPRPAYQNDTDRQYGCLINGYNVTWSVEGRTIVVTSCHKQQ